MKRALLALLLVASPALGQDNENVYGELLGYSPEKIAELRAEGVL